MGPVVLVKCKKEKGEKKKFVKKAIKKPQNLIGGWPFEALI